MVDLSKIRGGDDDDDDKDKKKTKKKKKKKSGQSKKKSQPDTEPYSIDEPSKPGEMEMADTSKEWAEEHGELNYDKDTGELLEEYMNRQVEETSELYDNIREMSNEHMGGQEEFTLYFHTLMLNLSNNRLGIMNTLQEDFNKSERQALKLTDKICKKAGEQEMVRGILNDMVKDLWEYTSPE